MRDRHRVYPSGPQPDRGDPPTPRFGAIALAVAIVFAVAAVLFAAFTVLAAVLDAKVETTAYNAAAAVLFALLAVGTAQERSEARRRTAERRARGHRADRG